MLRNQILPAIIAIVNKNLERIWLRQDGAGPHFDKNIRNYFSTVFRNQWIGRRRRIEWPPWSPDLSPLNYFLWGYLKNRVFETKPRNLDDLRRRILEEATFILNAYTRNAVSSFYDRIAYCQTVNGGQFEQLLWHLNISRMCLLDQLSHPDQESVFILASS